MRHVVVVGVNFVAIFLWELTSALLLVGWCRGVVLLFLLCLCLLLLSSFPRWKMVVDGIVVLVRKLINPFEAKFLITSVL